jgi:hypothetical protein
MALAGVLAGLVAMIGAAGPAAAHTLYSGSQVWYIWPRTSPNWSHSHAGIWHWDTKLWDVSTGGAYGNVLTVALAVYTCPADAACTDAWRAWVADAVSAWNTATEDRAVGTRRIKLNPIVTGPLPGYPNPCGDWSQTQGLGRSYVVPICFDPGGPGNNGEFGPSFEWSNNAYHLKGGKVTVFGIAAGTTWRLFNTIRHELGHVQGLGHRGAYGHEDPYAGMYHAYDPTGSTEVMGFGNDWTAVYPDLADVRSVIYLNGGALLLSGSFYCWNDHSGWCPGYNSVG